MRKKLFVIGGIVVIGLVFAIATIFVLYDQKDPVRKASKQISEFKVYYFKATIPGNFSLVKQSVHYESSILTFQLKNSSNQRVSVTEQTLPNELTGTTIDEDRKVQGADGMAVIGYDKTRTIGTLFGTQGTLVLINTNDPIGSEIMKDLLRALRPLES